MVDFNKPTYDVYLVTIGKNIDLSIDEEHLDTNFKKAILTNNLELLKKVLVQQTTNNDEFKEIVTNKIIKGCIVYTTLLSDLLKTQHFSNILIDDYVLINPIFHHYNTRFPGYRTEAYEKHLIKANSDRIIEYMYQHANNEEYSIELNNIFKQAKEKYSERIKSHKLILLNKGELQ